MLQSACLLCTLVRAELAEGAEWRHQLENFSPHHAFVDGWWVQPCQLGPAALEAAVLWVWLVMHAPALQKHPPASSRGPAWGALLRGCSC